jgi:peptide deformylase
VSGPGPQPEAIRIFGDPCLRHRCREVGADEDMAGLVRSMAKAMARADGLGLAAPQVGDDRRVLLARDPDRGRRRPPLVMINPRLISVAGPAVVFEEGCLSFPGLFFNLERPRDVVVAYRDVAGEERTLEAGGLLARIVQHEIDHLDGKLFIDHLPMWRRWLLARRLRRLRRGTGKVVA